MSNPARFQGLDVFWQLIKPQIQNRHEASLALAHWLLVGSGYKCLGHETELPADKDPSRAATELLPTDWNDRSSGFYSLLYIGNSQPSKMILLKLIPAASITDNIILGQILVSGGEEDVIPFEVNSASVIPEQWQVYASPTSFPQFKTFVDTIDKDVIDKLRSTKRGAGSGTGAAMPQPTGVGSADPTAARFIPVIPAMPAPAVPDPFAPLAPPPLSEFIPPRSGILPGGLGSRDLDPFHGTGGNIFGPRDIYPGGLPGSGVGFPGRPYRYDPPGPPEFMPAHPFGDPLGTGSFPNPPGVFGVGPRIRGPRPMRPFEPDPDHMRPPPGPGDDPDNMFM
ncbi:proteasome inhibitor PI31 subunit-like [Paramacrobiotus metropolitanus]|uniref:proteasome inhibitor PI31 subunit-like n=1 Tax=Paramacrobiotus metropolitanus TaxID=2943436 RepID=UPI0024458EC9|nr:proteasome inhibitor PI31 subunit-like [Paramacrobiotus metropolitanus]